jgi:hypothetical protein
MPPLRIIFPNSALVTKLTPSDFIKKFPMQEKLNLLLPSMKIIISFNLISICHILNAMTTIKTMLEKTKNLNF